MFKKRTWIPLVKEAKEEKVAESVEEMVLLQDFCENCPYFIPGCEC